MIGARDAEDVTFDCDSSLSGYGAVYMDDWTSGAWDSGVCSPTDDHHHFASEVPPVLDKNINVLYPVLMAVNRWGPLWNNKKVVCRSDNTQVVWALNKGRSSNTTSMALLRQIFWLSVLLNFHLVAVHVPGVENILPDTLSRLFGHATAYNLPDFMCCSRSTSDAFRLGSQSGGDQNTWISGELMENSFFPVEILHDLL